MNYINRFYHNDFFEKIFHTLVFLLKNELYDCKTVLDLGCGLSSPIQYVNNIEYTVGVEIFKPYLEASKRKGIHTLYINKLMEQISFPEHSFDAVILIDSIEHLSQSYGKGILMKAEKWAKKKIIVTTPNGFWAQNGPSNNSYQIHRSGWDYKKMSDLGFVCKGLAGLKILRQHLNYDNLKPNLFSSIRFHPRAFWFLISALSQIFIYYMPRFSFGLFCVKDLNK